MSIPETTSAQGFARFVGGKCLTVGRGKAWRDLTAQDLDEIESAALKIEIHGARYPEKIEK